MRRSILEHIAQPFVWGTSDCAFVFDTIRDMTGFDAIAHLRGYATEREAMRRVRETGISTILELVTQHFVEIEPEFAQRGDIGYPSQIGHPLMSPAMIDGTYAYSKEPRGNVIIPRTQIVRAWRV